MTETPDSQPDMIVDGVIPGCPLITIEQRGGTDVDITSAVRWENPDGSVFALVALEMGGLK